MNDPNFNKSTANRCTKQQESITAFNSIQYPHFNSSSPFFDFCCFIVMGAAEYSRKSGQIPAFGDWENANDLPITQYFECARQAGLLRCSCSGECPAAGDLYADKPALPRRVYAAPPKKTRGMNSREQRKQVKVRDLMTDHQPRNDQKHHHFRQTTKSGNIVPQKPSINVKPVDEDLYKIPSELLENSKRKKMLGFFSRCMVPPCAA